MMKKTTGISLFFRRYILIWLPILLVSFVVAQYTMSQLKMREEREIHQQLKLVAGTLDELYSTYSTNSVLLSSMVPLRSYRMQGSYYNAIEGIRTLFDYASYDRNTYDIIFNYGDNMVYTSVGYSRDEVYFSGTLGGNEESVRRAVSLLKERENTKAFLWSGSDSGYMMLHFAGMYGMKEGTSVNYLVDFEKLGKIVSCVFTTNPECMVLRMEEQKPLYFCLSDDHSVAPISEENFWSERKNIEYTSVNCMINSLDGEVELIYRSEMLYTEVCREQIVNYLLLTMGMIISVLSSLRLSIRKQQKIQCLEKMFDGAKTEEPTHSVDEYNYIRGKIQTILQETSELQSTREIYIQNLKKQTTKLIFHGIFRDDCETMQVLEMGGIELCEENFFVCGLLFEGTEKQRELFMQSIANEIFCEELLNGQQIILLFEELPNVDSLQKIRVEYAETLMKRLLQIGAENVRAAISQSYQNLHHGCFAYQEVIGLLEQMQRSAKTEIRCWKKASGAAVQLKPAMVERFLKGVIQWDTEETTRALKELTRYIILESGTEENSRYLRYSILQRLGVLIQSELVDNDGKFLNAVMQVDPSDGERFEMKLLHAIHEYFDTHKNQDNIACIIEYIHQNYSNCDLTAEQVAAYGGINKTYLSRLFKAKTQRTYIEYLTMIRMEKAKELLRETDMSIAEITTQVGYLDASSFRRKFRALQGISAQEYRKQFGSD